LERGVVHPPANVHAHGGGVGGDVLRDEQRHHVPEPRDLPDLKLRVIEAVRVGVDVIKLRGWRHLGGRMEVHALPRVYVRA
jgi:hypothetical protein